jgi:hypothetical protein
MALLLNHCFPHYRGTFDFCLLGSRIHTFTPPMLAINGARTSNHLPRTLLYALLLPFKQCPRLDLNQVWRVMTAVVQYDYSSKFCTELPLTFPPQLTLSTVSCCGTPTTILSHAQMHLLFHDWLHISLIQQCHDLYHCVRCTVRPANIQLTPQHLFTEKLMATSRCSLH